MLFDSKEFESRKQDHLRIALSPQSLHLNSNGLEGFSLPNEPLASLDFNKIDIGAPIFGCALKSPCFVSSMTAGHAQAKEFNRNLAKAASARSWALAVGSQRRELDDPQWVEVWRQIRKEYPELVLFGNLGISELIKRDSEEVLKLLETLKPAAFFVHLNPVQEVIQPEGNRNFEGAYEALKSFVDICPIPVIVKEVGFGIGSKSWERILQTKVAAVDVAGAGGTNWALMEGLRSPNAMLEKVSRNFANWGINLRESLEIALKIRDQYPHQKFPSLLASGGLRTGVDAAKCIYMGARLCGFARVFVEPALQSSESVEALMEQIDFELRLAMFATGCRSLSELEAKRT